MKFEFIYNGKIENGELKIANRSKMAKDISLIENANVEVIIRKKKVRRSLSQNAYYFSCVIPYVQQGLKETGERLNLQETDEWVRAFLNSTTKDQTHKYLKDLFIESIEVNEDTGEIEKAEATTRKMTKEDFSTYIDKIKQFAAEHLGIDIPDPNTQIEASL